MKTKNGVLLSEEEQIMAEWKNFFKELLNGGEENEVADQIIPEDEIPISQPTEQEISNIIQELKNNNSPGGNDISAEMLKAGGKQLKKKLTELIKRIWDTKQMPIEWSEARICPIHKKGDKMLCENYRGVALLDTCYKVLSRILKKKNYRTFR